MKTGKALRGSARLAFDTVEGVTHIVEGMYRNIAAGPLPWGEAPDGPATGIAGFVHASIRRVNGAIRSVSDLALRPVSPHIDRAWPPGPHREAAIAALNGICGDHLERTGNTLAIPMQLRVFLPPLPQPDTGIQISPDAHSATGPEERRVAFASLFETEKRPVEIHPRPIPFADPEF